MSTSTVRRARKFNVLFMASSKNIGLTFNLTRLAVALKRFGHKVIVVSEPNEEEKGLFNELKRKGVEEYTLCGVDHLSIKKTINAARTMGKIIDTHDIDVIHANGIRHLLVAFLASKIFCRKKKIGIVASIHSTLHGGPYENVALLIESFLLNTCADLAIPVAKAIANKLVTFGLFPNKIAIVHNGIDLKLFDEIMSGAKYLSSLSVDFKDSSCVVVSYFANMIPRKAHCFLIKAVSEILREYPNVILILTSHGPLRKELEALVRSLDMTKNVHFTGRISHKELYRILEVTDIYAFPSLSELFPFAILEAMAAAKPIVATNVGGVSEAVIDGVNGYLVPPKDPSSMAKAILKLIEDPDKARKMGMEGRRILEQNFSMDVITSKLSDVYKIVMKK